MNRYLLIVITIIVLLVHIGMVIYFSSKPHVKETKVLISLLIFAIISGIIQLIHLIKDEDINCIIN